jgi:hypothetical protein
MATQPNTLEAFRDAADADETTTSTDATAANSEHVLEFEIDGYDKPVKIDLAKIPDAIRLHLFRNATKSYVTNRVSTAESTAKKSNALFDGYDAAQKNDPLQTLVPKPEGERTVVDYNSIVDRAINALYTGEIGRRGAGTPKLPKDPLNDTLLRTFATEILKEKHATNPKYTYFEAKALVGNSAQAHMDKWVAARVAEGKDEKLAREYLEAQYVKPARLALRLDKAGGSKFKDFEGIL